MSVKNMHDISQETIPAGIGVSKGILISPDEGPNFAMRVFEIQPGGSMPNHTNQVEHEQFVLSGRAKIGIGEEIFEVKKEDVVFIPADIPHWYETIGEEPFRFLCLVPNKPDSTTILK